MNARHTIQLRLHFAGQVAKPGTHLDECQDAMKSDEQYCAAIADGVSRSFFPAIWAKLLVETFCLQSRGLLWEEAWREWLEPIQTRWLEEVTARVEALGPSAYRPLNNLKMRSSATATFVGLELLPPLGQEVPWRAIIIGDSCLFHTRKGALYKVYLLEDSSKFSNATQAFYSLPRYDFDPPSPQYVSGEAAIGDRFLLATDALAHWLIQTYEQTGDWAQVEQRLAPGLVHGQFAAWVEEQRETSERPLSDDVTLLIVEVSSEGRPPAPAPRTVDKPPRLQLLPLPRRPVPLRESPVPEIALAVGAPDPVPVPEMAPAVEAPEPASELVRRPLHIRALVLLLIVCSFVGLVQLVRETGLFRSDPATIAAGGELALPTFVPSATNTLPLGATETAVARALLDVSPTRSPTSEPSATATATATVELRTTPTVSPSATALSVGTLSVPSGVPIQATAAPEAPALFIVNPSLASSLTMAVIAPVTGTDGSPFYQVVVDLWSISVFAEVPYTRLEGQTVEILVEVNARLVPEVKEDTLAGFAQPGSSFAWLETRDVSGTPWYRYRVSGYVPASVLNER